MEQVERLVRTRQGARADPKLASHFPDGLAASPKKESTIEIDVRAPRRGQAQIQADGRWATRFKAYTPEVTTGAPATPSPFTSPAPETPAAPAATSGIPSVSYQPPHVGSTSRRLDPGERLRRNAVVIGQGPADPRPLLRPVGGPKLVG